MSKSVRLCFLLIVLLLLEYSVNACSIQKSFYQEGSGWDFLRFPLLKTYYAIKITDEFGWTIPLNAEPSQSNFRYYPAILNVKKIAIESGTIMVYSTYAHPIKLDGGQEKELHWFILIPDQNEIGFETEEEFNSSLKKYGMDQPKWQEPLSILQKFDQTNCLEWIPDCR